MELLQLKYFCDAAETQNFSKTAKNFFVPPSNISQSIKRLENELGIKLFIRNANKVKLNENYIEFYKKIKAALDLLESAQKFLQKSGVIEPIKVNIQINRRVVMEAIEDFKKKYLDFPIIITYSNDKIINDYDFIITDKEIDTVYEKQVLKEEKLLLAHNRDIYVFKEKLTAEELKNCPFITMGVGNSLYYYTNKICNDLGFDPHIVLENEDPFYIRKCIGQGLGVAIVPEISWSGQYDDCVEFKSLGNYSRTIYLYQKHTEVEHFKKFHDTLVMTFKNIKL